MRDLPTDWKSLRLAEVCDFHRGLTYKKADEVDFSTNAVLRANNISLESGELDLTDIRYIDDQIKIPAGKKVRKGSLLVCMASGSKKHLGKAALIDEDYGYAFGGFMGLLLPNSTLHPKYFYWITQSRYYSDYIMGLSDGANINNLKFSQLGQFRVPLPPLPEQKRIVAILDEAFAGIATAVANTEKNLANARELFESYLNSAFAGGDARWPRSMLREHANIAYGYTAKATINHIGPKFLRITDIQENSVDWNSVPFCSITEKGYENHRVRDGDIVFARTGATTGKSFLVRNPPDAVAASYLIRLSLNRSDLLPGFLILYFRTAEYWKEVQMGMSGSAQGGFNASKLSQLSVPIPSKEDQISIIERSYELSEQTKVMELIFQRKLAALAELKQSLLQKAFSGELTAGNEASDAVRKVEEIA